MTAPARRLLCAAMFMVANLIYCERVASGTVDSTTAGAWGALAVLWVVKIALYRPRNQRRIR